MNRRILLLIGLALLVVLSLVGIADPEQLLPILRSSDPVMVLLAIASYTLAIAVFALIWAVLLKASDMRLSFIDVQRLVFSAVFFNVVTPTASYGGEAVRLYLLSRRFGGDTGKGTATVVAHRIIGTLSNSFGTFALGAYLILFYSVPKMLLLIIAIVTFTSFFGFLLFLYLGLRLDWSKGLFQRFFDALSRYREVGEERRASVFSALESYNRGLWVLLRSRKALLISILLGLVSWGLVNMVAIFSYRAVGGRIGYENFLLLFTFFSVARLIPTGLPEFVGSKEAIFAALYSISGLPVSTSVAVSLLIRVATQLWMVILGGAVTLQLGVG
ncbi:MAG: UPF0104 family protein, partial [Methanobacteriota archaeon]